MSIYEIILQLRNEPSMNKKKDILRGHKDNEILQEVLKYTYTRQITFGVSVSGYTTPLRSIESNTIENTDGSVFLLLDGLSDRRLSGNEAKEYIHDYLNSCSYPMQQIFYLILNRDLKCGIGRTMINSVFGKNFIQETPYMGAVSFSEKKVKKLFANNPYLYSDVKMDGRYCNFMIKSGGIGLESRQGLPMGKNFQDYFQEDGRSIYLNFGEQVLNGELIIEGVDRYTSNGIIASYVAHPEREITHQIKLVVWDSVEITEYMAGVSRVLRTDRLNTLETLFGKLPLQHIGLVKYKVVHNYQEALQHFTKLITAGEEGTILKSPNGFWESKKPTYQVKFKLEETFDLVVTEPNYGKAGTKNEGLVSSLTCTSSDGLLVTRAQGLKEGEMKVLTKNVDLIVGQIIEVKHNGISQDSNGDYSVLHPVFVKIRDDKEKANSLQECQEIHRMNTELK